MLRRQTKNQQAQAGFTLVELAIVMIIIGLLIGGVLKGQQLITNAQVTAQVAQIKAIDAAMTSFRDAYNAVPGDMAGGMAQRLPNCVFAPCITAGDGDGRIDNSLATGVTFALSSAFATEQTAFWSQLNAAGLITGVDPRITAPMVWGGLYPATKINGGGLDVGWNAGNTLNAMTGPATNPSGTYLALHGLANSPVTGAAGTDGFMTQNVAARIDTKLDDGQPNSGTVLAAGGASATGCASTGAVNAAYNEALGTATCALYVKFQN